tara:strand:- start:325 stop:798 length:474 start_codon:yes stop_codon:yes gene_type:complete
MRSDYLNESSGVSNLDLKVRKVTASVTLDGNDSGSVILVNPTATTLITLPTISSVSSGWNCKVMITEDAAQTDAGMNQIVSVDMGSAVNLANVGSATGYDDGVGAICAANDDFFVWTAAATAGDYCDFFTDGERWYAQGYGKDLTDADFSANAETIA